VLAAPESWTLPLAVILIVPMTMLSALFGVWLTGGDNNVRAGRAGGTDGAGV
jgi:multidrug efflux pump subunit AcrB